MFTGIVQELGTVESVSEGEAGTRIRVRADLTRELGAGDSVAVNGVCLTALAPADGAFEADLSSETTSRTSLGGLAQGDRVNLELPVRPSDRLGGHIVQGHVDAVGAVEAVTDDGSGRVVRIAVPAALLRYVVEKGSVTVDGVSLTVAEVDERGFAVSLIPETLARTTLGGAREGRPVNLEVDVIAKHVERLLEHRT